MSTTVQPVIDVVPLFVTLKLAVNPVFHTDGSEYAALQPVAARAGGDTTAAAAPRPPAPSSTTVTDAAKRRSFLSSLICILRCTSLVQAE